MAATRSVPRLLQRPPESRTWPSGTQEVPVPGECRQKGDLRTPVESSKPSRERETGDLETAEREIHGRA